MKAAIYRRSGKASEVLSVEEREDPLPGPGEVRVRVLASGVNPSDVKNRSGFYSDRLPFPEIIPHSDGAGIIDRLGQGVEAERLGERVWTWNAQFGRPFGTAADFATLPAAQAVRLPETMSFEEGACLGVPALTAYRNVTIGDPVAGQTVLVTGGAGAVGHYAIQFARLKGARVLATVSSPEKARHAAAAGAEETIDYRKEDVAARVEALTGGRGVDRLIEVELGLNLPLLPRILARHGTVCVIGSAGRIEPSIHVQQLLLHNVTFHFRSVYLLPIEVRQQAIAEMTALFEAGKVRHAVGAMLPLARIAEAHELVERAAVIGKVVVKPN